MEDIEGLSQLSSDIKRTEGMRDVEIEYIGECLAPPRPEELVARIDEIAGGTVPSKAIDSNPQIAEMIEPYKDSIPNEYLEAPTDIEQVSQISDIMSEMPELRIENWKKLSINKRVDVLNRLEGRIAEIEHRPSCPVYIKDLGELNFDGNNIQGHMGLHSHNFLGESITINERLVANDNPIFQKEVLDTIIHEGRHSYQTYNLEHRETHTSHGDITNWHTNMDRYGYQNATLCGFKSYWLQPVEADARKFAEDVLTAYKEKI